MFCLLFCLFCLVSFGCSVYLFLKGFSFSSDFYFFCFVGRSQRQRGDGGDGLMDRIKKYEKNHQKFKEEKKRKRNADHGASV